MGLAKVKVLKGEFAKAVKWLQDILKENPSYMKAYDVLSQALGAIEDNERLQENLEQAVEVSPMSIGRQLSLAKVAFDNGDAEVAASAFRKAIKYGVNSCHDTVDSQLNYAKSIAHFYDNSSDNVDVMVKEALNMLSQLGSEYSSEPELQATSKLLGSQLWLIQGDAKKSQDIYDSVMDSLEGNNEVGVDVEIEIIHTLILNNEHEQVKAGLQKLLKKYKHDQSTLEKIDPLLPEPVSEKGKRDLSRINKKGFAAYKNEEHEIAVDYFIKVEKRYPRYIGIKLNLVQAIIGKMRAQGVVKESVEHCQNIFQVISRYIVEGSNQYKRYRQLQDMLQTLMSSKQEPP